MVISDSFHIAIRYSIKVFTPFLDTFKWTPDSADYGQNILNCRRSNPQFLESPHFDFCCGLAKVADRWILVTMLQTKDHLFDCPAEFHHHSPDTKSEPSDHQAILRMEGTNAFLQTVAIQILHSSHIHLSMNFYSNQVLKDTKKMFEMRVRLSDQNNREVGLLQKRAISQDLIWWKVSVLNNKGKATKLWVIWYQNEQNRVNFNAPKIVGSYLANRSISDFHFYLSETTIWYLNFWYMFRVSAFLRHF